MAVFISRECLPRRTFLRGLGATLALPLLDEMSPSLAVLGRAAGKTTPRLGMIYVANGMGGPNLQNWLPAAEGPSFELTPILEPLSPFRDQLLVLSGLSNKPADPLPAEGGGDHARGVSAFLTCAHPHKTEGPDIRCGISMDQIVAKELGQETQLASLELGMESGDFLGTCDPGYTCAYTATMSWRTPTTPLPMENDARAVFERLFGASDSTDPQARAAQVFKDRSILDSISSDAVRLQRRLGARDRAKMDQYLEGVRDVERRIQKAEGQSAVNIVVEQPAGSPATFDEHAKLMFDLAAMAWQADLTRVFTFMMAREFTSRTYPESGVAEPFHATSHHQRDPERIAKLSRINRYHVQTFAHFLERLRSTSDGDGSLLDHSTILYGGGLSDGDKHNHVNLPIAILGGGAGRLKGGRHVRLPMDTPLANVHLTLLNNMGIQADRFGDSTGRIEELS
jgi:hypothetical protein